MSSNSLESSKTMAGIGAILLFLSFIPLVGIVGLIMVLIGMKGLAEYYRDDSIYRNAIMGVIYGIIGVIAVSVGSVLAFFGGLFSVFTLGAAGIVGGILTVILIIVVTFVFYLLMAIHFKRAFDSLAQRSGEQTFNTSGTLLFWGAVLTIIGVGLILIFIAWIMATIAFFSIKVPIQPYAYQPTPTAAPYTQPTRFCPNCGAPVDANATFCPHCGKQLPSA
jgi:uncharacterized membrane protein